MKLGYNMEVGKRLAAARKNKDMSRAELGKLVGLHESTVKRYEDGEIKALSVDKLKDFAQALNIDPEYLMAWETKLPAEVDTEVKGFTMKLVRQLLDAGLITDPDNIPQDVIDMIIVSIRSDIRKMKER